MARVRLADFTREAIKSGAVLADSLGMAVSRHQMKNFLPSIRMMRSLNSSQEAGNQTRNNIVTVLDVIRGVAEQTNFNWRLNAAFESRSCWRTLAVVLACSCRLRFRTLATRIFSKVTNGHQIKIQIQQLPAFRRCILQKLIS